MTRKFLLSIGTSKKLSRSSKFVLIAVITLTAMIGINLQPQVSIAQENEVNQISTGSTWQNASFPVENFQEYTSPFGPRGYGEFHYGLDLAAPLGSYIRNWWGGQVVEVFSDGRCGNGVIIKSGSWEHIYCHVNGEVGSSQGKNYLMDRAGGLVIWQGQIVPAGARIARVGMTGRTTGPHLHWGLKYGGQWVDPATVLQAMYMEQSGNRKISSR